MRPHFQGELDDLYNSQGNADKNVHELEKQNKLLETEKNNLALQLEELSDEAQILEVQNDRLGVNLQAAKSQHERDLQAKEEAGLLA